MFKDVIISSISTRLKIKKGLIMLLSFLFHSTIIFAVFIGPLLETDTSFSEVKVVDVFLTKAPPQVPKALIGKKPDERTQTETEIEKGKVNNKNVIKSNEKIITPLEIPEIIIERPVFTENIHSVFNLGVEGGFEGLDGEEFEGVFGREELLEFSDTRRISIRQARRIKYVKPLYPRLAEKVRLPQITVIIEAKTDIFGNVVSWRVISGHPLLNGAAVNAIKKWKYEPYIVGGIPKSVEFTVTINFTLRK